MVPTAIAPLTRILTYNVHGCRGRDGRWSPQRIADVIAPLRPAIVALQELDVGRTRSGRVDQAAMIATALGMRVEFNAALEVMGERYGDAILTALPCRVVKAGPLPGLPGTRYFEPRGAIWAAIDVGGAELNVINTHLGLLSRERRVQIECLLGPDWIDHPRRKQPAVLVGDLNVRPGSRNYRLLCSALRDAHRENRQRGQATFPSRFPAVRLDYAFVGAGVTVDCAETVRTPLARVASDHLPVIFDLKVAGAAAQTRSAA
ncbi:MAG: endonuclease/exonuclease/phosphatase family protein [Xanthobacteraceae bacterium]|uniref:endonuclease/exonuclease/phosphatase family protein n=1 Tax=Pseudolabrys sp. TaxID=1960880 RepID=UPI003D110446